MSGNTQAQTPPEKGKSAEKEYTPYSQQEVNYVQVSGTPGQMCQNCRWFRGYTCAIVNDYAPKSIVNTGWCNQWTAEPETMTAIVQPVVILEDGDVTGVIGVLPSGERSADEKTFTPEGDGEYFQTPPMNIIVKGITQPVTPRQTIFKDASGRRYMFIVTSNGYKDREDEWIPAAELKNYVENCWIDEKTFHSDNPLLFWHDDRLKAGDIIWADMQGTFLIELAREGDGPIAKALWDYREDNPNNELWGASHGFRYRERSAEGVYAGVRKKETSFLPLWAAANLLTASEVLTVSKSRDEFIDKLFGGLGITNAAELLRSGPQALTDALTAAGVQSKSVEGTQQPLISKEAATLIVEMVDAQKDMLDRLDAIETKQKEAPVIPAELAKTISDLAAGVRQIQATLELDPTQASKDDGTVVEPANDKAAKEAAADLEKKQVGQYDPFFGDMKIPIQPK
jgi:hypothetical protein